MAGENEEHKMSWEEFDTMCHQLAAKIVKDGISYHNIICVARGGLVIGRLMSDILELPLHVIYTQRYKRGSKMPGTSLILTDVVGTTMLTGNILVVDDITDEGVTMKKVTEKIESMVDIQSVKSAVLYHKPKSVFQPDYYVKKTGEWIIFPYERHEYEKNKVNG